MENELKRARKRSFALEEMSLNRRLNGIYDRRKYFEMGNEYNEDSRDVTTRTNEMTDYALDHIGWTSEITDKSCDRPNTSSITDESHEHMRTNRKRKKAVHSYAGRTNHAKEGSLDVTRTTNHIRENESEDSIKLSERNMTDDPRDTAERASEVMNKIQDLNKNYLNISLEQKKGSLSFHSETGIEAYENRKCLGEHERNVPRDKLVNEASSGIDDLCDEVFYPMKGKRDILVGRVDNTRRRSSI